MSGIYFSICGFIFIIIFIINFFSKRNTNNNETKLYKSMLIATFIGTGIDIFSYILYKIGWNINSLFYTLLSKMMLIYFIFWILTFLKYVYLISKKSIFKIKPLIFKILFILFSTIILCTSITFKETANAIIPTGLGVNMTYFVVAIGIAFVIVLIIENYKNIVVKKYTPIFLIIILLIISFIIQRIFPDLFLINFCLTIIVCVMYFTIENPDVKVIETLNENRKLIEKTNEEKLNILFELQQKTKEPIKNIQDISNLMLNENNKDKLKEMAKQVNTSSKELMLLSNNVFDISNMDISNIKLALGFYDVKLLFKEIEKRAQEEIQGDVELRTNYTDLIDAKLYGDKVKLKQVLISILNNSLKQTKKGFIEIKVNSIVKYDVCRLIISISDSGCGIGVEEVNRILSANYMEQEDFKKLDKVDVGIEMANKIIKVLGGTLIVRSEINKGSEYLIIIDQKIKENKDKINFNQIDTRGKRKILIVNENLNEAKKMEEQLIKLGIDVTMVLYGKGAIEKIKNGEEYDMIIVDDEMRLQSGYDTLKKLQTIKKFKTPVLISIDDDKKFLVSKYIEDGFKDYILKSNLNEEIKKVNKYL